MVEGGDIAGAGGAVASGDRFWTLQDAARAYTRLAALSEALFVAAGRLGVDPGAPAAERPAWATLSRLLGLQAAWWADLVPESVLLAPHRAVPEVTVPQGAVETRRVLAEHLDELGAIAERLSPVADGAALRVARQVRAELAAPASEVGIAPRS